jgi:hypothetical protein
MNALDPIVPQLSKLVLLLSSNHDGEVIAAARAIDRVLKSSRLDWHDLAQAICLPLPAVLHPCDDRDWARPARILRVANEQPKQPRARIFAIDRQMAR